MYCQYEAYGISAVSEKQGSNVSTNISVILSLVSLVDFIHLHHTKTVRCVNIDLFIPSRFRGKT
jgi:hypothetical protein